MKNRASALGADGKPTRWARANMLALKGTEGIAKSSFDVRGARIPGAGAVLGAVGAGIDLGRATGVGGVRGAKTIAARVREQEEAAKLLEKKAPPGSTPEEVRAAKQVTATRQQAFAQQLKTPPKFLGVTYTRPFTTSVEGDIEAARKIEKGLERGRKEQNLEGKIKKGEEDLKTLLAGKTEEEAIEHHEKEASKIGIELEADKKHLSTTEQAEMVAKMKKAERAAQNINRLKDQIARDRDQQEKDRDRQEIAEDISQRKADRAEDKAERTGRSPTREPRKSEDKEEGTDKK